MKVTITGLERNSGISKKTGNAYSMGSVYALLPMQQVRSENRLSVGFQGATYDNVDPEIIKRIEHNPLPFDAEMEIVDVIRWGKKEGQIVNIVPIARKPDVTAPREKATA